MTNCITQLNRLDCESESEDQSKGGSELDELANGEVGGKFSFREVGPLFVFLSLSTLMLLFGLTSSLKKSIYFRERERERAGGGADSPLSKEPEAGLDLKAPRL